jgi:hypothetical protein
LATSRLCFLDGRLCTAVGDCGVQGAKIDAHVTRVPVNYGGVTEVLAKGEVRLKELFVARVAGSIRPRPKPSACWEGVAASGEAIPLLWPRAPASCTSARCEALPRCHPAGCQDGPGMAAL